MEEDFWNIITALFPSGVEVLPKNNEEAEITFNDNSLNIVCDFESNSFTINGKTLHFIDSNSEIIGTILVPYIMQELDGQRRV